MHRDFPYMIVCVVTLINLGYAAMTIWLLQRRTPRPRFLAVGIALWALLMTGLFVLLIATPEDWKPFLHYWFYFPMAVQMVWNVLFVQLLSVFIITFAIQFLYPKTPASTSATPEGLSRRKFLYLLSYGAGPTVALGMGVHGTLTRNDLRVKSYNIPIANLPPELEGYTIAHVSDIHSGLFVGERRLKIIHEATNDLKCDLVTITGDVINTDMSEFPAALEAMTGLESRHGTYLCEGNHDLIPGPGLVLDACNKSNLPMLYNTCMTIPHEGKRILLAGLPWMRGGFEGRPEIVSSLFPERQEGDVRILMAHHPHLFDIADSADLVLSGHTHGGQIMIGDTVGLGPIFFKYWSGLYAKGNTTMIVSNGCGDWFPCRIGAPAEIGLLRLTRTKTV